MNIVNLSSIPRRSHAVRRRRRNGATMLISYNNFYDVDSLADVVWQACDGVSDVGSITHNVAVTQDMPEGLAAAAVIAYLAIFATESLVEW
jgi:uncharacterized metal-binding protein